MNAGPLLFVIPPLARNTSSYPPLGPLYLASAVRAAGFEPAWLDLSNRGLLPTALLEIRALLAREIASLGSPRAILIGPCLTLVLDGALTSIKAARSICDAPIVVGGPHFASFGIDEVRIFLRAHPEVHALAIGEAEESLIEFLHADDRLDRSVPGIVARADVRPDCVVHRLVDNLDALDPARDLLSGARYFPSARRRSGRKSVATVMASRGCHYGCAFCCAHPRRRIRSVASVCAEVAHCASQLGVRKVIFFDDLFLSGTAADWSRMVELCEGLRPLDVEWQIDLRSDIAAQLPAEAPGLLRAAGCSRVNLGIEQCTEEGLRRFGKRETIGEIVDGVRRLRREADFILSGTFIVTPETVRLGELAALVRFARNLDLDYAVFNALAVYPGTALARDGRYSAEARARVTVSGGALNSSRDEQRRLYRAGALCYGAYYFLNPRRLRRRLARAWLDGDWAGFAAEHGHYFLHAIGCAG